jgi:hypothetical protein
MKKGTLKYEHDFTTQEELLEQIKIDLSSEYGSDDEYDMMTIEKIDKNISNLFRVYWILSTDNDDKEIIIEIFDIEDGLMIEYMIVESVDIYKIKHSEYTNNIEFFYKLGDKVGRGEYIFLQTNGLKDKYRIIELIHKDDVKVQYNRRTKSYKTYSIGETEDGILIMVSQNKDI